MDKKRFIYPAIFLAIMFFLFIIPISTFLVAEIVGIEIAKSIACSFYKVFKDQGTIITGMLAFLGVWITIKEHRKQYSREAMERQRLKSLDMLIQLKILSSTFTGLKFDYNYSAETATKISIAAKKKLTRGEQKALEVEVYLSKKRLNEDLLKISLVVQHINLFSSYLTHFRILVEHPEFKDNQAWKWRVDALNDAKRKIVATQIKANYGSSGQSYIDKDFDLSCYPSDSAILSNMWFFIENEVLKDLIYNIRCIDKLGVDGQ